MWGNVLKSLITHVENVSNRILCMDYAGRLSKTFKAKSYNIMVLELISMMAEECWENWDPIEECIVKFIAVDLRDEKNRSLLHLCIEQDYPIHVGKILLSSGANITARDGDGKTPAHYALESSQYCNKEAINLLLQHKLTFVTNIDEEIPCLSCTLTEKKIIDLFTFKLAMPCCQASG